MYLTCAWYSVVRFLSQIPSFIVGDIQQPLDVVYGVANGDRGGNDVLAFDPARRSCQVTLAYGFVKAKIVSEPMLKPSRHSHEIQYHLHFNLLVDGTNWDVAVNVGTNDADDLLKYKFAFDFRHPVIQTLAAAPAGSHELTGQAALPALDFMRSDLLADTGSWGDGIHDTHMNQGSTKGFVHRPGDDSNDHNDVWQDGAVMVDVGEPEWAAYFAAFNQQLVPTDDLGNPLPGAASI
jgi:uncharacterized protein YukJ